MFAVLRTALLLHSLRNYRLSTAGSAPCAAEKISGKTHGGLFPEDGTAHSPKATVVARLIVPYQGVSCGSMSESRN